MDSLSSVSPSIVLPPPLLRLRLHRPVPSLVSPLPWRFREVACRSVSRVSGGDNEDEEEVERALQMDGTIPGSSKEFVERVSSRAYHMRRDLLNTFDTSSYDGGGKWRSGVGKQTKQSSSATKFQMLVEDIRDGVLVFEDEREAASYCDLLQGGGQGCEGVAEIEASSVFDLCRKMKALAVLFRRGQTPPLPERLQLNLRARKRSLEDQE